MQAALLQEDKVALEQRVTAARAVMLEVSSSLRKAREGFQQPPRLFGQRREPSKQCHALIQALLAQRIKADSMAKSLVELRHNPEKVERAANVVRLANS